MRRFQLFLITALICLVTAPTTFAASDKVGTDAPPFKVNLLEGGELNMEESLGKKVILLDFWSIYCVSCVQEMPYLAAIQKKYPDDLLIIGVDLDSFGSKRVKKFVNKLKFELGYPIVVDKRRQVAALYSVSVLPTTVIIDLQGKINFYHVGFKPGDEVDIEKHIKDAIAGGQ